MRLSRLFIRRLAPDQLPYLVDGSIYQRYDQRNNLTVGRPNWDSRLQTFTNETRRAAVRVKHILSGRSGYHLEDYSLYASAGILAKNLGTAIDHDNRGLTSWNALGAKVDAEIDRWEGNPVTATAMVKRVARFFGADLVGIAQLDKRWIYSHAFWADGTHKEIVFDTVDVPLETSHELIIPESARWVIVMGVRMDRDMIQFTPTPTGCAEVLRTYSQMAFLVAALAEFLRGIGYQAIPSINGLGLSIPMAIDAGLGEQGRHGKLITPEFGPCVRLCKVVTTLPLVPDRPIRFGVTEFCQVCKKCAVMCPSKAIPEGERAWSGPGVSENPGVYAWRLNNEACRRYWVMGNATPCTICIRVCPFTKSPTVFHDLTRVFISRMPALNALWVHLDNLLGYGRQKDAQLFWRAG